jgi:hypothetical protein
MAGRGIPPLGDVRIPPLGDVRQLLRALLLTIGFDTLEAAEAVYPFILVDHHIERFGPESEGHYHDSRSTKMRHMTTKMIMMKTTLLSRMQRTMTTLLSRVHRTTTMHRPSTSSTWAAAFHILHTS